MLGTVILSIFIFLVILLVFVEYRNEKKYQEERRQSRERQAHNKRTPPSQAPEKVTPRAEPAPKVEPRPEPKPEPKVEVKVEPKPVPKTEEKIEPKIEVPKEEVKEAKKLPEANYPPFTHARLVEMGLSDEEAKEFVAELIPQIEEQIPLIEEAMNIPDFHQMERLTHSIKGSATNIGTGGVSDLLVAYNTYLKTGTDIDEAKAYFEHLKHYTQELKEQYT
jgi:HPt (histidine-containing phosphotransfer) domain-containing protein